MKTFKVKALLEQVNASLSNYTDDTSAPGMIMLLEYVLHETGNYHGYKYLEQREVPFNQKPGIRPELDDKFIDTDKYRRRYF